MRKLQLQKSRGKQLPKEIVLKEHFFYKNQYFYTIIQFEKENLIDYFTEIPLASSLFDYRLQPIRLTIELTPDGSDATQYLRHESIVFPFNQLSILRYFFFDFCCGKNRRVKKEQKLENSKIDYDISKSIDTKYLAHRICRLNSGWE